jgi:hypothetical protein
MLEPLGTLQDDRCGPYEPEEKGSREEDSEGDGRHIRGRPGLDKVEGVRALIWILALPSFNIFPTEMVRLV